MMRDPVFLLCAGYLGGAVTVLAAMFPAWFLSLVYEMMPAGARRWLYRHRITTETRIIYYILAVIVPLIVMLFRWCFNGD